MNAPQAAGPPKKQKKKKWTKTKQIISNTIHLLGPANLHGKSIGTGSFLAPAPNSVCEIFLCLSSSFRGPPEVFRRERERELQFRCFEKPSLATDTHLKDDVLLFQFVFFESSSYLLDLHPYHLNFIRFISALTHHEGQPV